MVGSAEAGFGQGRDLTLRVRLSPALGKRLRVRWVRVKIATTFRPGDGQGESVIRHKRLSRQGP